MAQIKITSGIGFSYFFFISQAQLYRKVKQKIVFIPITPHVHIYNRKTVRLVDEQLRVWRNIIGFTWLQIISVPRSKQHTIWLLIQALHKNVSINYFDWQEKSKPITLALTPEPEQVYFRDALARDCILWHSNSTGGKVVHHICYSLMMNSLLITNTLLQPLKMEWPLDCGLSKQIPRVACSPSDLPLDTPLTKCWIAKITVGPELEWNTFKQNELWHVCKYWQWQVIHPFGHLRFLIWQEGLCRK